jgi:hypothetical protein
MGLSGTERVFGVPASAFDRMDGGEQTCAPAGCFLRGGLLLRERDLHPANRELIKAPAKNMRIRAHATLALFAIASVVAWRYPYAGLGICCCCLIGYLRPAAPGSPL